MPAISITLTAQGANSSTFQPPPLDGTLNVPELFAYHATNSPNHPLFVYADDNKDIKTIYYPEAYRAIRRAGKLVSGHYKRDKDRYAMQKDAPTFGILAVADTISYFTLMTGIMHLGFTPFPISTRNSAVGVAHLMGKTGILQLFVSPDPAMQRLAQQAIEILAKEGTDVEILNLPQFEDIYNDNNDFQDVEPGPIGPDTTVLILHSSGSTAFPKPIKIINRNFLQWGILPSHGEVDICGTTMAAHSLPMFHAMGAIHLAWTTCSGLIMGCFKPASPPVIPTPDVFLQGLVATRCQLVYCVPVFVEAWARLPENLPILRTLKCIIFAGAPMNKSVGDLLVSEGVTLTPFYGSTEVGSFSMFIPKSSAKDEWEYFKVSSHLEAKMIPQEGMEGVFEAVVMATSTFSANVSNTTIDGRPAFATNDLLQIHPTKPDFYKVHGRADDQLMLSTGEKTNPVPLETMFLQDQHITAVIMFGRGRFQNGVLIQPKEPFDPAVGAKLAEFRNAIWPTVEKINEFAPSHSRIFKEMIIVTNPNKPLEFTPKGTPRRQVCLEAYAQEVDAVYLAVKDSSQTELVSPTRWTYETTSGFIRTAVSNVVVARLDDDDDIFQQGCDSLQATWIRNTIIHALRASTHVSVHKIPYGFVYSHPSITALAKFVYSLISEQSTQNVESESQVAKKIQEMHDLLDKHSSNLPSRPSPASQFKTEASQVILVTGTTGRLGSHLLAQLLQDSSVDKIFALNRDPSRSATEVATRQLAAFRQWGIDVALLSSAKVTFLAGDSTDAKLGLDDKTYNQLRGSLTTIIHNAWRVDFNITLASFEPLIVGVRHLIDLALSSSLPRSPKFMMISSISVLRNHSSSAPAPEAPVEDARISVGSGYSESKWVAEHLLARARKDAGLDTTVVRVGQLSGDTLLGRWNPKEWVAALVEAGKSLSCMPLRHETISWVPVDIAAIALGEFLRRSDEQVLHLISPRPVEWAALFTPIASRLQVPLVPYSEWLALLRSSAEASVGNRDSKSDIPALSLIDFFVTGMFGAETTLSIDKAVKSSPTLAQASELGNDDAMKWLQYWADVGFIKL